MNNALRSKPIDLSARKLMGSIINQRSLVFGLMIIGALLACEVFNYSTTQFALNDVLGSLTFLSIPWATILSIAFCGIDFAGVARLFTPEQAAKDPTEVWYLFGAWVLAAAMNATLTWWGVSIAIANHVSQGSSVINNQTIQTVVPVFVAIMVLVIRIMIIGTFSMAGERMLGQNGAPQQKNYAQNQPQQSQPRGDYHSQRQPATMTQPLAAGPVLAPASSFRSQQKPSPRPENGYSAPAEPTYHNLNGGRPAEQFKNQSNYPNQMK